MLKLFNTFSGNIEEFKPLTAPIVTFYVCGPTVYDYAHIGHSRTYIFNDILRRVLLLNNFQVKSVMNITDVGHLASDSDSGEDKMEKGAKREGKSVWEIARFFTKDFFRMTEKLSIGKFGTILKATDCIDQMINLIKTLETNGYTYRIDDGIYFDTEKFQDYGKLTKQSFTKLSKTLKGGSRVELVKGKKNITDFALWKFTPDGEKRQMEWDSPWGRGFPGWHIECSAMSIKGLGETLDIHTGGVDHIPIHHTNEIAQSEAATGKKFVRYWLHAEHLLIDGEKMSKSLGNYIRLDDLEKKGYDPLSLRYLFLTASYRFQLNFTYQNLDAAQKAYQKLKQYVAKSRSELDELGKSNMTDLQKAELKGYKEKFINSVNDDLNTAQALALVWEVVKSSLAESAKYELILFFDKILGLSLNKAGEGREHIPADVAELVKKRSFFREKKMFEKADKIREKIEKKGFIMEDLSSGPVVRKIS